ncbi:MAG: HAD family hydrolase [Armatimonadetes bacterium]|nr:HAD family hydrolase [Armatimonadota bacterium]
MSGTARLQGVKAVYFDLDDTLCGYWDAAKAGLRAAFDVQPVPGKTTDEMIEAWAKEFRRFAHELKTSHWYEIYLTQGAITRVQLINETLAAIGMQDPELAWRIGDAYGVERDKRLKLFPESKEVLSALHQHFPLGLITNGPADVQRQEIETLGIGDYFDHVFIEGEMGIGKPHASVMRRAENAVGCKGKEILFVGNSYAHDMLPAIEVGWQSAWVRRSSDVPPSSRTGKPEDKPEDGPSPDLEMNDLRVLIEALVPAQV